MEATFKSLQGLNTKELEDIKADKLEELTNCQGYKTELISAILYFQSLIDHEKQK